MQRGSPFLIVMVWALLAVAVGTADSEARIRNIDTETLREWTSSPSDSVFLLDVRTPREFAGGRVPGSVLIPMNQIPRRMDEIPRDQRVVVICTTGARSGAVTQYLNRNGITSAVNYGGGVADWARKGFALER